MLTSTRLREILDYDPDTGVFTRRVTTSNRAKIGDMAGFIKSNGYRYICIDGKTYREHRLVWLFITGAWPDAEIDHINLEKADNRFANLRAATRSENLANTRVRNGNTSRLKGISWHKRDKKWRARIAAPGKQKYLGNFDCPAAAHFAYIVAADKAFGEFARAS